MYLRLNMRWLLLSFLFVSTAAAQPSPATLQNRLNRLLNDDFYQRATAGIAVYDLTDQKTLFVYHEKRLCRPASNMKLITSAAALTTLTPGFAFKTGLYHTGTIGESGHLSGDIYLTGGFDPELTSANLDTLIIMIKKSGIRSMDGNLYLDVSMADSVFWGAAWSWDDDMEAYQPYLSPIPLNKGVVKLKVIPASPGRAPIIRTEPESAFIQVVNRVTTVQKSAEPTRNTLRFSRDLADGHNLITVSGTISSSANAYETMISLKNPQGYVLTLFAEKLSEQFPESNIRIAVTRRVPTDAHILAHASHSMAEVVMRLNKESDNLNAEMLLYALGSQQDTTPATTGTGIAVVQQFLEQVGHPPTTYRIVDGSGLSNQNYLTPELLVDVLKYMHQSPNFDLFRQSLPIAGVDGTLANRMKNSTAYRKVTAKTGTLTSVTTLSGYATARNGHLLAFSIMIQNFVEKASYVNANHIDKICEAITE